MFRKFRISRRWLIFGLIAFGVYMALGHWSNAVSLQVCEKEAVEYLTQDWMRGHSFNAISEYGCTQEESLAVFARHNVHPNAVDETSNNNAPSYPWASIGSARSGGFPFLVKVPYGVVVEALVGQGGERIYFCFFGYIISISDAIRWIT